MNLISCNRCGVVLDENKLQFPDDIYRHDGVVDDNLGIWDIDEYVPYVKCPVCGHKITQGG